MEQTREEKYDLKMAEREECVSKVHLKLCLRLAELEATGKSLNTPPEHKMTEVEVMSKRVAFLERGVTRGCCRYQESKGPGWTVKCVCCKPEGSEYEMMYDELRVISELASAELYKPQ
jgi:hypothetical protein